MYGSGDPRGTTWVVHLDMDCFFVSVERLLRPDLVGVPVIVGGDPSGRGVVCSASYEARRFGVHSAMPMGRAMRLCPRAVRVPPRGPYGEYSRRVRAILEDVSPDVIGLSIDEFACDLTGCERMYDKAGGLFGACQRMRQRIADELGLPSSFGLATNALVAKIAAGEGKPEGEQHVPAGEEAAFLAPLPVGVIPGVGPKMRPLLDELNVRTVGQLIGLGKPWLERRLGRHGLSLWERAHGQGAPLDSVARAASKSMGKETTFAKDVHDPVRLERTLSRLCEDACRQLRAGGWQAATITLKLRYADFKTITRSRTVPLTELDTEVFPVAAELLAGALAERRVSVRLIGVRLSGLRPARAQGDLFDEDGPRQRALLKAADALTDRYGHGVVRYARSLSGPPRAGSLDGGEAES